MSEQLAAIDLFDSLATKERKHLIMRLVESVTVYRSPDTGVVDATVKWRIPLVEAAAADKGRLCLLGRAASATCAMRLSLCCIHQHASPSGEGGCCVGVFNVLVRGSND